MRALSVLAKYEKFYTRFETLVSVLFQPNEYILRSYVCYTSLTHLETILLTKTRHVLDYAALRFKR